MTVKLAFTMEEMLARSSARVVVGSVLETLGSRGVSDSWFDPVCFGTESPLSRYAPSENQK